MWMKVGGVTFISLLSRPFISSLSSRGHNQRMEFLGDSIMQLVATEYLFIHFPDHHEGHLTVSLTDTDTDPPAPPSKRLFFVRKITVEVFSSPVTFKSVEV